jgi:hypothetical protein
MIGSGGTARALQQAGAASKARADRPGTGAGRPRGTARSGGAVGGGLKRPPIREDLKVMLYQSQEADNTFITSDGTSPYNSTR